MHAATISVSFGISACLGLLGTAAALNLPPHFDIVEPSDPLIGIDQIDYAPTSNTTPTTGIHPKYSSVDLRGDQRFTTPNPIHNCVEAREKS